MSSLDFAAFFTGVHEVPPLPWQQRLAALLTDNHEWPDIIELPTASGKTACLDIALFHLAWCAQIGEPWRAARRIVLVVDRRIIVDAAARRAERIQKALEAPTSDAVRKVADSLRRLGGEAPLRCQKLRGGMAREPVSLDPAQPMIITSTIDQIGSRLLFRGYGVSPYSTPVHAGLLGHDTLILLDEAHLGESFANTVRALIREQARAERPLASPRPLRIVPMSATTRQRGRHFRLDATDLAHHVIASRRTAPKRVRLVSASTKFAERLKQLRSETLSVFDQLKSHAPAVAVIVNRVKTARALFELLSRDSRQLDCQLELMIGRSRPLDRDKVADRVIERAGVVRGGRSAERGLIVVATQTIEVGADLDFQGMVTECASLDALLQRFGRLDRLGEFRRSCGVVVGSDDADDDPVYGSALQATWEWLNGLADREGDLRSLNFSIEAMEAALENADVEKLTCTPGPQLELAPAFVDLLCQTAPRPACEPDVAALLHGFDSAPPDVQVVWRMDVPTLVSGENLVLNTENAELTSELLDLNPPGSLEALSLPVHAVRAWLDGVGSESSLADIEGCDDEDGLEEDGEQASPRMVWRRTEEGWQPAFGRQIRPGDTIVVPSVYGGCDEFGFSPASREPVSDLSAAARAQLDRSPLLIAAKATIENVSGLDAESAASLWGILRTAYQDGSRPGELLELLIHQVGPALTEKHPWLGRNPDVDVIAENSRAGERGALYALVVVGSDVRKGDISDEDLSSSRTVPISLNDHNQGVGERARVIAEAVGLAPALVKTLECAGRLHDLGKADPRFQNMLRAGDNTVMEGQLLAKGARRVRGMRFELGERHEAYSVAFLKAHPDLLATAPDRELAIYLIGTHHGRGRALMPDRPDDGTVFNVDIDGVSRSFEGVPGLGALGSDWPALFWRLNRRYGAWGLAYLEAVLRLADQLRSHEELAKESRQ
ncbi:MAG: type I-U CRISPR-associated helicase/endonuclease Cas3 [Steroidobacteraceae bacterium]|nr:type I-U CRISPR-associated helicase/endonuclease Cas3 [Steroidobacteraceae bacterium]